MPPFNNGAVTTCSATFFDTGGSGGNYFDGENYTLTIYPATVGQNVRLSFTSFSTESGYDFMYIYNGINTSAPLLYSGSGTALPLGGTVTANNAAGALTIVFTSDGIINFSGWAANVSCVASYNPCASTPTLTCGTATTATFAAGSGAGWNLTSCYFAGTPGEEKIFLFTAPSTGTYTLNQTASSGFVDYFFKAVSGGCSSTGWTCIDDLSGPISASFFLTGGVQYYILADPEFSTGGSATFSIGQSPVDGTLSPSTATTVCLGQPIGVTSSGGTGTVRYWAQTPAGGGSWNVFENQPSNAAGNGYTFTPSAAGTYRIHARWFTECGFCWDVGSCPLFPAVDFTVVAPSAVGAVSANQAICPNTQPANMTIASATGTIQWQMSPVSDFTSGVTNVGTNSTTLTSAQVGNLSATRYFRAVVTNSPCGSVTSNVITVTVTDTTFPSITCPSNINVNNAANTCAATVTYTAPVGTDNCPGPVTTQIAGLASGSSFPVGTTTNTFRVTDGSGNTAQCSFTVTVTDNQLPTITCPTNIGVNTASGQCHAVVTYTAPVGSDNCSGATTTRTAGPASGSTFSVGVTTITHTVTAANGQTATCSFTVTVTDNQPPTANCQNIAVTVGAGGTVNITPTQINNGSSDNCTTTPNLLLSVVPNSFTCSNTGANTVTLTVNDGNGNTNTCTATVTVNGQPDDKTPALLASPICSGTAATIQIPASQSGVSYQLRLNADNSSVGTPVSGTGGAINLSTGTLTFATPTSINYNVLATNTANGCTRQLTGVITVQVIPNPSGGSITAQSFCAGQSVLLTVNSVSNASAEAYQWSLPSGITAVSPSTTASISVQGITAGTYTVTVTPQNVSGATTCNGAPVTGTVTVKPLPTATLTNNAPAICSGNTTNISISAAPANVSGTTYSWSRNNTGDVSGTASGSGSSISVALTNNTNAPQTVEFTVTPTADGCNGTPVTTSVVVNPTPSVTINNLTGTVCSGGTTNIGLSSNVSGATFNWTITSVNEVVASSSSATGVSVPISVTLTNPATATRTVVFQITPVANGCPGIPQNAFVQVIPQLNTANSVLATSPVCDSEAATITISSPQTQVVYQARKASDNTLVAGSAVGSGSITIPVGILTYAGSPHTFNIVAVSNLNGACTATLSNQAVISVLEKPTPPTAVTANGQTALTVCPGTTGNLTLAASGGYLPSGATIRWYAPFCGTPIGTGSPLVIPMPSATTTYYVAYDNGSSCSTPCAGITVTVGDFIPPNAVCQGAIVQLNSGGTASITPVQINNNSTDNCVIGGYSLSQTNFTCAHIGNNTVTLTVTDGVGNQGSCTATVTVQDLIQPTITCPTSPITLYGCSGVMPNLTQTSGITLANSSADFSGIQGNKNWYYGEYSAFNTNGFTQLPNFTGFVWNKPGTNLDFPQLDANGGHPQIENLNWAVRRWESNYTGAVTIQLQFYDRNTSCGDGAHVRLFRNNTEVWQYLNIPGSMQTFNIPINVTAGDKIDLAIDPKFDAGCDDTHLTGIISITTTLSASDNCTVSSITQSVASGAPLVQGNNTVTLTATDQSGNTATCNVNVILQDNVPPTAVCNDFIVVQLDAAGNATITPAMVNNGSTDNCGIATIVLDEPTSFTCADAGGVNDIFAILSVTDFGGNTSICETYIYVEDSVSPDAQCVSNLTVQLDSNGYAAIGAADLDNGSADNCGIEDYQLDIAEFSCDDIAASPVTVTLTVIDFYANQSQCTTQVTVQDNIVPEITCPTSPIVVTNDIGESGAVVTYSVTAEDNCSYAINQTAGLPSGSFFTIGATTNTFTVTDAGGNAASCSFTVTVNDAEAPVVAIPDGSTTVSCLALAITPNPIPTATDNYDTGVISGVSVGFTDTPNPITCEGTRVYTYSYTDAANNTSYWTYTYTIEYEDFTMPANDGSTVACAAEITLPTPPVVKDNCNNDITPTF
ncbi:MAG TPA: HYR domain-containing protein, partial [Chitinophagales bacterium]|nr:HYR domain-containing protein [Chitinophagales bacterium]